METINICKRVPVTISARLVYQFIWRHSTEAHSGSCGTKWGSLDGRQDRKQNIYKTQHLRNPVCVGERKHTAANKSDWGSHNMGGAGTSRPPVWCLYLGLAQTSVAMCQEEGTGDNELWMQGPREDTLLLQSLSAFREAEWQWVQRHLSGENEPREGRAKAPGRIKAKPQRRVHVRLTAFRLCSIKPCSGVTQISSLEFHFYIISGLSNLPTLSSVP